MPLTLRRRIALLMVLCAVPGCATGGDSEPEATALALTLARQGSSLQLPYCAAGSPERDAERVVIVVHGDQRNACEYAEWVAAAAGTELDQTAVVAPRFVTEDDEDADADDVLYWSDEGWKAGANSRTDPFDRPWRLSSFEVVDELIIRARDAMPELDDIVVAGHSAGGQFVQRYAASTSITGPVRYVVANPSSYLYLDERRWIDGRLRELTDEELDDCPDFDEYKYGLVDRYDYLEAATADELRDRYRSHEVDYLLGEDDTDTSGGNLDEGCEAQLQGENRLERGRSFVDAVHQWFDDRASRQRHRLRLVPDVGHDPEAMFASDVGREALFDA